MNKEIPDALVNYFKLANEKQILSRFLTCRESVARVDFCMSLLEEQGLEKLFSEPLDGKADSKAQMIFRQAQEFYEQEKYDDSLQFVNKALCYVEPLSKSLCASYYSLRAKIYCKLQMYELSLENVGLASEYGGLSDPQLQLEIIRNDCLNALVMRKSSSDENDYNADPKEILSYPPYSNIPNVAECVKLKIDQVYGRVLVTDRDLKPGDIIMMEKPFAPVVDQSSVQRKCANCLSHNNFNLMPCPDSTNAMFCNKACYQEALKKFHNFERHMSSKLKSWFNLETQIAMRLLMIALNSFNDLKELQTLNQAATQTNLQNQFEFDFREYDKYTIYKTICSLTTVEGDRSPEDLMKKSQISALLYKLLSINTEVRPKISSFNDRNFVKAMLYKFIQTTAINTFNMWSYVPEMISNQSPVKPVAMDYGIGVYPLSSFMGHSCAPNVRKARAGKNHELMVIFVMRPIRAGDKICDCYDQMNNHMMRSIKERRAVLYDQYFFICQCEACKNDYPQKKDLVSKLKGSEWESVTEQLQLNDSQNNNVHTPKIDVAQSISIVGDFLKEYDHFYPSKEIIIAQEQLIDYIRAYCTKPNIVYNC